MTDKHPQCSQKTRDDGGAAVSNRFWLVVVAAACLAVRILVGLVYNPPLSTDAQGYIVVARMFENDFSGNIGARTPVYPYLVYLLGVDEGNVWAFQAILGCLAALVVYRVTLKLTKNHRLAGIAGLVFGLNLAQVFFETMFMSEAISAVLLVLLVSLGALSSREIKQDWRYAFGLGFLTGVLALTRPLFIYLGPIYALILWLQWSGDRLWRRVQRLAGYLLPFTALVLGWCLVNFQTAGSFTLTTLTGYNLINHTGSFMELAPDEYANVRDVYLIHRAARIAETGEQTMTVWRAYDDLEKSAALSYVGISNRLLEVSLVLIAQRPDLYLRSAAGAWVDFWKAANYWKTESISPTWLADAFGVVWTVERLFFIATNAAFLMAGGLFLIRLRKITFTRIHWFLVEIYAIVLPGSIAQALMDKGENARYGAAFQPLVIWGLLVAVWWFVYSNRHNLKSRLSGKARQDTQDESENRLQDAGNL